MPRRLAEGQAEHLTECLELIFGQLKSSPSFYLVAPVNHDNLVSYALFIESNDLTPDQLKRIGLELDEKLCNNFHYEYCRRLGQLEPVKVFHVQEMGSEVYFQEKNKTIRLGDIKTICLDKTFGWEGKFKGHFIN